jgi:hypothetical protein
MKKIDCCLDLAPKIDAHRVTELPGENCKLIVRVLSPGRSPVSGTAR